MFNVRPNKRVNMPSSLEETRYLIFYYSPSREMFSTNVCIDLDIHSERVKMTGIPQTTGILTLDLEIV